MINADFLNTYDLDEWYQLMEDRAYDDDDLIDDNDDHDLKTTYYPEEL